MSIRGTVATTGKTPPGRHGPATPQGREDQEVRLVEAHVTSANVPELLGPLLLRRRRDQSTQRSNDARPPTEAHNTSLCQTGLPTSKLATGHGSALAMCNNLATEF